VISWYIPIVLIAVVRVEEEEVGIRIETEACRVEETTMGETIMVRDGTDIVLLIGVIWVLRWREPEVGKSGKTEEEAVDIMVIIITWTLGTTIGTQWTITVEDRWVIRGEMMDNIGKWEREEDGNEWMNKMWWLQREWRWNHSTCYDVVQTISRHIGWFNWWSGGSEEI
jgi:hypothetical protein